MIKKMKNKIFQLSIPSNEGTIMEYIKENNTRCYGWCYKHKTFERYPLSKACEKYKKEEFARANRKWTPIPPEFEMEKYGRPYHKNLKKEKQCKDQA